METDHPYEERAEVLSSAADLAEQRKEELARINTIETGKLLGVSLWEMRVVVDILRYYSAHGAELLKPTYISTPGRPPVMQLEASKPAICSP